MKMNLAPLATLLFVAAGATTSIAQTKFFVVEMKASPFTPTAEECFEALNNGAVLPGARGNLFSVIVGDKVYVIEITPTYLECEGVQYVPI